MTVQIIEKGGKPEFAVLPYDEYMALLEAADTIDDLKLYRNAKAHPNEEVIPGEIVNRLLDGESPIKVWREYRTLTQEQLAQRAGISTPYISQLESGKRVGTATALRAIATALGITVDELLGPAEK